ncbi:homoserine O-acetyltransferase MetX [Rudaeicoccus suwonensis]|uniref:Homoserine O-acetyltransferase n=1 Tax=Rudaeicoccus suwonensis TaxID=657409 RepID=A0A561ECC6_9MICO|nr:homoserine O-acetyltransferase [Rudaeicoccus suwonensis]TWE13268.1 homoserine O-acetyltransferase [Rudaeicoccus suwonensis]
MTVTEHRPHTLDGWCSPPKGSNPAARAIRLANVPLDVGASLPEVVVTFQTWGRLNARRDNAVLVEHALTGDSHVVGAAGPGQPSAGWWPDLIGPGQPLDTRELYVVAANVLGGCRGTTGPASAAPDGAPWGARFPRVTIRDQVRVEALLADHLGVDVWRLVLGGSMGGMRAVEWAAGHPDRTRSALVIASAPWATADQIAWGRAQMQAIVSDPDFQGGDYYGTGRSPRAGLGLARQIAHTTYRSADEFEDRFGRAAQDSENPLAGGRFAVESYLDHQADKLVARFDAGAYLHLTAAMATHDITRDRGDLTDVLGGFGGILRVAAVDSDRLFPVELSELMARAHGDDPVRVIRSRHGHDGFLIETDQIAGVVSEVVADTRPARTRCVG